MKNCSVILAIVLFSVDAGCIKSRTLPAPQANVKSSSHPGERFEVRVGSLDCVVSPEDADVAPLIPCAWEQTKVEMYRRFPSLAAQSAEPDKPRMEFHNGLWYNRREQAMIAGDTDDSRVKIALTGDLDDSFDTMIHEFKHWWIRRSLQREARFISELWVDLVNSTWREDCEVTWRPVVGPLTMQSHQ